MENLKTEVSKMDFVRNVEEGEKNKVILTLDEDRREELIKRLVLAGVRIRSFYLDNELEEAYLNIVKEAMSND